MLTFSYPVSYFCDEELSSEADSIYIYTHINIYLYIPHYLEYFKRCHFPSGLRSRASLQRVVFAPNVKFLGPSLVPNVNEELLVGPVLVDVLVAKLHYTSERLHHCHKYLFLSYGMETMD